MGAQAWIIAILLLTVVIMGVYIAISRGEVASMHAYSSKLSDEIDRLKFIAYEYRDTWDHLPRSLPISDERKQLAALIGCASTTYALSGADAFYHYLRWFQCPENANQDPLILAFKNEKDPEKILEIPRTILFQSFNPEFHPHQIMADDGPMTLVVGPREQPLRHWAKG